MRRAEDASVPIARLSQSGRRILGWTQIWLVAGLAAYMFCTIRGSVVVGDGSDGLLQMWLHHQVLVASAGLCLARAALVGHERRSWVCLGSGLVLWTLASMLRAEPVVAQLGTAPWSAVADLLGLSFYPLAYAGVVLLVRRKVRRCHASLWLDGTVAGVGVAVLAAAFALGPIAGASKGTGGRMVNELVLPLADLVLLALVIGVFGLLAWRPGRSWQLLGAGLVVLAVADSWYLVHLANQTYAQGTVLDALRPVGIVLVGLAAWRSGEDRELRPEGCAVLAMPTLVVSSALGVLVYSHFRTTSDLAVLLAAGTLVAAMVRTALVFREIRTLADTRRQASTDELTGLGNRRLFYDRLTVALGRRGKDESLALLLIDLDRFKEINNTLGHHVGDMLLRQLGPRLSQGLRSGDLLVRLGGDEFAVLLGPGRDAPMAETVARRVLATLKQPFELGGVSLHVDASVGIALAPEHATERDTLLQKADVAMYQAKRASSGCHVYDAQGDPNSRDRLETIEQLRVAVESSQLVLHYQPKFDLLDNTVVGVEALVRWAHPDRGLMYPDSFIGLAEQTGIMRPLTLAVLDMALGQCRAWHDDGLELKVAVNLSVSTLLDTRLPDDVAEMLKRWRLSPTALELEITENVLMVNPVRAQDVLNALRSLGVTMAVDDYGTGYSSLAYLRQLNLDELKLGSTFVTNMVDEPGTAAIVRSTVDLAHSLGLRIVAEGVETEAVLSSLTRIGCDMAQGYYLSRPKPAGELTEWLHLRSAAVAVG